MKVVSTGGTMQVVSVEGDPRVAEVAVGRFRDDERYSIEVVDGLTPPLKRKEKWIINVSTQFGCPVGCPFCDAAHDFIGNLTTEELLTQVRWAIDRNPGQAENCQKLKVHFARMGEPSLNDGVIEAIDRLPDLIPTPGLWACVATIAPRHREGWFMDLYKVKEKHFRGRFQLQFSVQSTKEKDRDRLIPMPHWTMQQLAEYGNFFHADDDPTPSILRSN
jgi:23S rRNA (adenine2503-C2)-methyltransferase